MSKLNHNEIERMAKSLAMTIEEAEEVAVLFENIKVATPLKSVDDYINEWESRWHRENSWSNYYNYEKANCFADYEYPEEVFHSLDSFKAKVASFSYELPCGLIAIIC